VLKITPLVAFITLATTIVLTGCNQNPVVVLRKPSVTATTPAEGETPPAVGTTSKNSDGTYTLEFPLPKSSVSNASRSLINYEDAAELEKSADYYQLVLVDDSYPDTIWASADAARDPDPAKNGILRVVVKENTAYHLLFLHGKKAGGANPTLLGSGYIKYQVGTTSDSVTIRMVPLLIDATVQGAGPIPWAGVKNIMWAKAESFNVTVNLFSRSANLDPGKPAPHGNALWPLRLAEARRNPAVWKQFQDDMTLTGDGINEDSPQYPDNFAAGKWNDLYWRYDGEKNLNTDLPISYMSAPLKMESVGLSAKAAGYYSEGLTPSDPVAPDPKSAPAGVDASAKTITGTFAFSGFNSLATASQTSDYAKVSFNDNPSVTDDLTYIPFGDALWGSRAAPQWKIVVDPIYLAYRLYGRDAASNGLAKDAVSSTGVPTGVSWATASKDLQYLAELSSQAYTLDPDDTLAPLAENQRLKEIWVEAGTYTNIATGSGTVINVSAATNGTALYGGFKSAADAPANRLATLNSRPATRTGWFNTYATLDASNEYGTVVAGSGRETILDGNDIDTTVLVDGAANLVLDGFTLTHSNQSGTAQYLNGLIIKDALNATLFTNLNVSGNSSTNGSPYTNNGGGGIYVSGGAPRLENITADGNTVSDDWGSGIMLGAATSAQIKNARFSNNTSGYGQGGGIAISKNSITPRLENIIVTGNVAATRGGGGIYVSGGDPVIVNAIISGNSADAQNVGTDDSGGGGILVYDGNPVIVNALISGNKSVVVGDYRTGNYAVGGGGIKIVKELPTFINVTVSGNYSGSRGGGIFLASVANSSDTIGNFYNIVVLGNYSQDTEYSDDDVYIGVSRAGGFHQNSASLLCFDANNGYRSFLFNNSLLGGRTVTGGVHDDYDMTDPNLPVTPGGGNVSGYNMGGYTTAGDVDALATWLNGNFFVKFAARPTELNTGHNKYVAADWDFHLEHNAGGAIEGGIMQWLTAAHIGNSYPTDVLTDLEGKVRVPSSAASRFPDMGAYESDYLYIQGITRP
jgi:hypothetical protein